jgi:HTH-type transcriptional regulator / antitoxin HigA
LMKTFLAPLGGEVPAMALCRRTINKRSKGVMDNYALLAWTARVLMRANNECCPSDYVGGVITKDFMREVARLSLYDQGPLLAKELLEKNGIAMIVEQNLPKTWLDGGAMLTDTGNPVIGLTLRHDRIDNFWFSLMHELSHIAKHLRNADEAFIDDFDLDKKEDPRESEADRLTREVFIPRAVWARSDAYLNRDEESVIDLSKKLRIHHAVIAGRLRWETGNYSMLSKLVGQGEVRRLFFNLNKG